MVRGIVKRTAILFGFGLLLNGFPYYHLATIRIPGVLQRIGAGVFLWRLGLSLDIGMHASRVGGAYSRRVLAADDARAGAGFWWWGI